jgi:hypothetical protein
VASTVCEQTLGAATIGDLPPHGAEAVPAGNTAICDLPPHGAEAVPAGNTAVLAIVDCERSAPTLALVDGPPPDPQEANVFQDTTPEAELVQEDISRWGYLHASMQHRADEILDTYNGFFEQMVVRKGWRTPPFQREEVQVPFQAASEVVAMVRARLDEENAEAGGGIVLRQVDGTAKDFFWNWDAGRPPSSTQEILGEFFRGLVFATLSDAHGLVEGLHSETVEHYISSHPLVA